MRPNRLTLTAFGPYRDEAVIDFDALAPHNLFVIAGSTGSGKTTIFDGLSYALYGNASGEDRENYRSLRSDFANNETPSRVALIFTVRGEQYRVARQIPYLREGNRTETPGSAELFRLSADGEWIPAVDRQNIRDVNEKIESLIGFTHDQFNQLVMLPQGEYRRFLTANTENREVILRKIFNTEIYADLVDQLKRERDEKRQQFERLMGQREQLLLEIKQLPQRETPLFERLAAEQLNIHQASAGLAEERAFYQAQLSKTSEANARLKKEEEEAQAAYHQAEKINQQLDQLIKLEENLTQLNEQQPAIDQLSRELQLAESAQPVAEKNRRRYEIAQAIQKTESALKDTQQARDEADTALKAAQKNYEAEKAKGDEREMAFRHFIALEKQQANVESLKARRQREQIVGKQADDQSALIRRLTAEIEGLKKSIEAQKREEARLNETSKTYEKSQRTREMIDQHCQLMRKIEAEAQKIERLTQQIKEAQQILTLAERENHQLTQRWLTNQATLLAQNLIEGEPCPVCGGTEHPAPLHHEEATMTEAEYHASQQRLNEAKTQYQRRTFELEYAKETLEKLQEEQTQLGITLNAEALQQELIELDQTIDAICNCHVELEAVQIQLSDEEKALIEREAALASARELMQEYNLQYQAINLELRQILNEIPTELRDIEAFNSALTEAQTRRHHLEQAWEAAQAHQQSAERALTEKEAELRSLTNMDAELRHNQTEIDQQFSTLLRAQGFKNEREYRAAERPQSRIDTLRQQIQAHQITRESLKQNITHQRDLLKGQQRQSLTPLSETLTTIKEALSANLEQQLHLKQILKMIQTLTARIAENLTQLGDAEIHFGRLNHLYNLIRGDNPLRLSFERYILIEYLERVIDAANIRLREISNGQFEFVRSETQASRGRQSGLDLDVYDAYTGQTRDVKTMSGGEKFKASLCLSLGMADVIQSFKGGISIDTLFIDEGFGSLDEESLQQAIDVLIDLQKSGRMIGVISHVEELKQVLPARIEVTKSKSGFSRANVVVD